MLLLSGLRLVLRHHADQRVRDVTDWPETNELLLCDILGSDAEEINHNLEKEAERQLVLSEVKKLCPRECKIVELRFGLNGNTEHTQKQVADMMGISQSYISRLEKKIIKRLKCGLSVG